MEKNRAELKELGIIFLIFAVYHVFMSVIKNLITLMDGSLVAMLNDPANGAIVMGATIAIVAVWAVSILLQIYLGVKGVKIGNGASVSSGAHIGIAKLMAVMNIILAVILLIGLFTAPAFDIDAILTLLIVVCDIFLLFSYAKNAKLIREAA